MGYIITFNPGKAGLSLEKIPKVKKPFHIHTYGETKEDAYCAYLEWTLDTLNSKVFTHTIFEDDLKDLLDFNIKGWKK